MVLSNSVINYPYTSHSYLRYVMKVHMFLQLHLLNHCLVLTWILPNTHYCLSCHIHFCVYVNIFPVRVRIPSIIN